MVTNGILFGLVAMAVVFARRFFFRVEEGHLAVLSDFGAARARPDDPHRLQTFGPGLHAKAPWSDVHQVSAMEQNLDLSGEEGGRTAMAEDGTILRFDSILRFTAVEAKLSQYLFGLRSPSEHITGLFTCLLRNEIANFRADNAGRAGERFEVGSYALIRRERRRLHAHIEEFSRSMIADRYGVKFNAVDLTDILPPDELADALNAVISAQMEAGTHYARAEGDCTQRVLAAEKGVEIARRRAEAARLEVIKLASFLQQLAKLGTLRAYVERRRAEVMSEARAVFLKGAS